MSVDNCVTIYAAAETYGRFVVTILLFLVIICFVIGCSELTVEAKKKIYSNFAVVSKSPSFLGLPYSLFKQVCESDDILDCDEAIVFETAVEWFYYILLGFIM